MKTTLAITAVAAACILTCSCNSTTQENTSSEMTIKEALAKRHSVRSYTDQKLSQETLLELLWAANGVNEKGTRTAPSAVNAQDIDLYVCSEEGVSKYDAASASLSKVTSEDIREYMQAQNSFIMEAPVTILLVTDQSRFGEPRPGNRNMEFAMIDAGIVSQNISLYCTAYGLGTVACDPRMNKEEVSRALGLSENEYPLMYHPVGYPKE